MIKQTPYLAVLILIVGVLFGIFFSGHRYADTQCLQPRKFPVGAAIWVPAGQTPLSSPAWSVTSLKGWQKFTCGNDAQWS